MEFLENYLLIEWFPYTDWAYFDRSLSAVETHFQLKMLTPNENLYGNTTISFSCSVNIPVVVEPVIWYTQRKGGLIVEGWSTITDHHLRLVNSSCGIN